MMNDEWRMMKAAIKREESQARLNFPEREQARPKVNDEWNINLNINVFLTQIAQRIHHTITSGR